MPTQGIRGTRFFSSAMIVAGLSVLGVSCGENPSGEAANQSTTPQSNASGSPQPSAPSEEEVLTPDDIATIATGASNAVEAGQRLLEGKPLEAIAPLVGVWEIDADWSWGEKLWGRMRYDVTLGGGWIESRAVVADGGSDPYHRYTSLIGYDADRGAVVATDFSADGSVRETVFSKLDDGAYETNWAMDQTQIKETILPTGSDIAWKVWMQEPGNEQWQPVMDDQWDRTNAELPRFDRPTLDPGLAVLEKFVGHWEIDASWADGSTLQATSEYSIDVGGKFIRAATYPSDGGAEKYHRYTSFFQPTEEGITVHGFIFDGSKSVDQLDIVSLDPPTFEIVTSSDAGGKLRQRVEMTSEDAYRWRVWSQPSADAQWAALMDGVWNRVAQAD